MSKFGSLLVTVVLVAASSARASGFYMGDNGSKTLLQGGAFVGQADDVTALQHNPAGLAQLDGFSFVLDGLLLNHSVGFTRLDPGFDPANPPTSLANTVTNGATGCNTLTEDPPGTFNPKCLSGGLNSGGAYVTPFLGLSYGLKLFDRLLTIGVGAYGPPAVGAYKYPDPDYSKTEPDPNNPGKPTTYNNNPKKFAPQRYSLVENNILLFYPTLSLAYAVHPRVLLGASLQLVVSTFYFRQAVTSQLFTPMSQGAEDPSFDSMVTVNASGKMAVTGIFGVLVKPLDSLGVGVSVRPPISITASGTLDIVLGESPLAAGASVAGNKTDLTLNLPLELKAGVAFRPISKLGINCDFVYQGWQALQEIVVTPTDVNLTLGGNTSVVAPFHIEKKWTGSWSLRLGAGFDLMKYISLHAGVWYETNAIPAEYQAIDFVQPSRVFITGGVTAHLGPIDVVAGVAGSPQSTIAVTQSEARAGSTDPGTPGGVVGTGIYTSSSFIATLGIRGHFGSEVRAARAAVFEPPAPTPEAAPPPAAPAPPEPAPASPAPSPQPAPTGNPS